MSHTPTPWGWWPHSCDGVISEDSTANHVAYVTRMPERGHPRFDDLVALRNANAEFIVRACNSHDALLAACKRMLEIFPLGPLEIAAKFGPDADPDTLYCAACDDAEKAIALATEVKP